MKPPACRVAQNVDRFLGFGDRLIALVQVCIRDCLVPEHSGLLLVVTGRTRPSQRRSKC